MNAMDRTNRRSRGVEKAATAHTRIRTLQDYGMSQTDGFTFLKICEAAEDFLPRQRRQAVVKLNSDGNYPSSLYGRRQRIHLSAPT